MANVNSTLTYNPRANIERIATLYNEGKFDEAQEALNLIIECCTSLQPAGRQEPGVRKADPVREALAELVACKDLKERAESEDRFNVIDPLTADFRATARLMEEYGRRAPIAWEAARRALVNVETAPQADGEQKS